MKFPDHDQFEVARSVPLSAEAVGGGLTALERSAVMASVGDTVSSIRRPAVTQRALHAVFGIESQTRFADPRLEALRRYAVEWRVTGGLTQDVVEEVRSAGFTDRQLREVIAMVRPPLRREPFASDLMRAAVGLACAVFAYAQVRALLDDALIAFVVVAILAVPLLPMMVGTRISRPRL